MAVRLVNSAPDSTRLDTLDDRNVEHDDDDRERDSWNSDYPITEDSESTHPTMSSTLPPPPPVPAARHKPSRSATAHSGVSPPAHPTRPRRSLSQDSSSPDVRVARAANTRTKSHGANGASKPSREKPSAHADFIDGLDISGGAGMFHHGGPFDAAAPSFNRTGKPHRAPMYAFETGNNGAPHNVPVLDKRLSPLAQATIAAMASSDGPYASASLMPPTSPIRTGEMTGSVMPGGTTMMGGKLGPSSRKMTLTEAWGRSEPEPFEEFSAGTAIAGHASSRSSLDGDNGYEAYQRRTAERPAPARRGESLDMPASARRNKIPPPQPIILPGARTDAPGQGGPSSPGATETAYSSDYATSRPTTVKRTKSLMQRIRNMRENPNVPVPKGVAAAHVGGAEAGHHSEGPYSPREGGWVPGPRTYALAEEVEPQTSSGRHHQEHVSPSKPRAASRGPQHRQHRAPIPESPEEPYVLVDAATTVAASREKALPAPPPGRPMMPPPPPLDDDGGYFDKTSVGRKPSLYQKMKGAVHARGAGR